MRLRQNGRPTTIPPKSLCFLCFLCVSRLYGFVLRLALRAFMSPAKSSADDALDDQVVGGPGHADADAKVDLPLGRNVKIDRRDNLLLLLRARIEAGHRAERAVILQAAADHLRKIVRNLDVGRELEALAHIRTMQGLIDGRIEGQIPASQLLVHNGTHLPRPGIFGKLPALIADLIREAQPDRPVPFFRNAKARAYMVAHPVPAVTGAGAGKDVEAGLKPVVEALRDFDGLMQRMVGG